MWVDIDDVRAELERLRRKTEEEFDGEEDSTIKMILYGTLVGYSEVEIMLDELEKVYRERESECVRGVKEEYEEPEVDWSKVPVDTLVRVRDSEDEEWRLRYFRRFINGSNTYRYVTWQNGATSKTANRNAEGWKYCELVEDEDGSN